MVGGKISCLQNGFRGEQKADALRLNKGEGIVKALVNAVDPYYLNWLASLNLDS